MALAEQGVDIIAVDLCRDIGTVSYALATAADLEETVRLVEERGRRIVASATDVRDMESLSTALEGGLKELGRLDIVLVNAGIAPESLLEADPSEAWANVIDVNLTGAWNTTRLCKEVLVKGGERRVDRDHQFDGGSQGHIGRYGSGRGIRGQQARAGWIDAGALPGVGAALDPA